MIIIYIFYFIKANPTSQLSAFLQKTYIEQRSITNEKTWPANQQIFYVPQSLMYHQGRYCKEETDLMIKLIQMDGKYAVTLEDTNSNHKALQHIVSQNKSTKVTQDIAEIVKNLDVQTNSKFLLIEAIEGMGKTVMLKEIAYRWAKNELLTTSKIVFLVHLQDPKVHELKTWSDFLQYFCKEEGLDTTFVSSNDVTSKDIAFLFDSFEEFPTGSWEDSFVYKVFKRKVLPDCVLIITSCPHASACLRPEATVRVYLLGFTEIEQKKEFINKALQDQQQIKEVTQYLENDSTLSRLCFSPINMVFLLHIYLCHCDLFFSNASNFYEHILCLIVCHHLAKHDNSFENIAYNLSDLPAYCNKILKQLCKLSVDYPQTKKKIIFTCEDIKETCPDIIKIPGAINGFGLLQAVQYDDPTGKTMKFILSHHIIQEALAAHHNQSPKNQLKCLRLLKTYSEAGNKEISKHIANAKVFDNRTINLRGTSLSSSVIKCLALISLSLLTRNGRKLTYMDVTLKTMALLFYIKH